MSAGGIPVDVPPSAPGREATTAARPTPGTRGTPDAHPAPAGQPARDVASAPAGQPARDAEPASAGHAARDAEPASGVTAEAGHGVDAVLAGLRRHARHLVTELAGPLRRVRLRNGDTVLEVEWHAAPAGAAPAAASPGVPPPVAPQSDRYAVRSPIVGTFYRAPEPGAAPFVAPGDLVRPGQVVGIVEAMKLMNEVTADRGGRVVEVLAADGHPVEYDQPLVALDPV
ncbi:biotin/lipoyl-containing protein [Micromonospora sp. LOL_025]|uniref:acetyl-CoA carboxylase biotin carboxyl carrier protein n=1 Tax=Micromonospora sp. LOL_025 TaxID=3345413 RepID=UPI003A841C41